MIAPIMQETRNSIFAWPLGRQFRRRGQPAELRRCVLAAAGVLRAQRPAALRLGNMLGIRSHLADLAVPFDAVKVEPAVGEVLHRALGARPGQVGEVDVA